MNVWKFGLSFILTIVTCMSSYASDLSEFWLDDKLLQKQAAEYVSGQDKIQVVVQPLNLAVNPVKLKVVFKKSNVDYPWEADMPKSAPSFVGLPPYDPSTKLQEFVTTLGMLKIQGDRVLSQQDYVQGVGNVKLVFRKKHTIQLFKFAGNKDWDVRRDYAEHKTNFIVQFGFEGDTAQDPKAEKVIHFIDHEKSTANMDGYWFLNANRRLLSVKKSTYKTVSQKNEKWVTDNGFVGVAYEELEHGKEPGQDEIMVLDPPASWQALVLKPADWKNRYFKFDLEEDENQGQFIFSIAGKVLQTTSKEWKMYLQTETKNGLTVVLNNTHAWRHRAAIVLSTKTELPCVTLDLISGGVQFVRNGNFNDNQFYRLNETQAIPEGFRQVWLEQSSMPQTVPVNIVRMKEANGAWKALSGFPNMMPAVVNGQMTMDITPHMASFTDQQWQNLKNYLIIAYWLEGKEPVLKCNFPTNLTAEQDLAIAKSITAVLKGAPCVQVEFSTGPFLVKDSQDKWSVRDLKRYNSRNKLETSEWHYFPFWQTLIPLIKEQPSLHQLDLRIYGTPNFKGPYCFFGESPQITSVLMTSFTRAKCQQIKMTDEEALKLLPKVQGLEELNLAGMPGLDEMDFPKFLVQNAATLKHLDLTGAPFSDEKGAGFVQALGQMTNLETLKLIGFYMSNDNTVSLAQTMGNKTNIKEVHLAMPYWPCGVFEHPQKAFRGTVRERKEHGILWNLNPLLVVSEVIAIPLCIVAGALNEPLSITPGGKDFSDTLYYLAHVKSLSILRLKVGGRLYNHLSSSRSYFNKIRDNCNHQQGEQALSLEFIE